jgi:hypothetical protein
MTTSRGIDRDPEVAPGAGVRAASVIAGIPAVVQKTSSSQPFPCGRPGSRFRLGIAPDPE